MLKDFCPGFSCFICAENIRQHFMKIRKKFKKLSFILFLGMLYCNIAFGQNNSIESGDYKLDKALVLQLDTIFDNDQKHRKEVVELAAKYGWESKEVKAKWEVIKPIDSVNLKIICGIIDSRGWLGPEIIGGKGNHTLFLVIQHSDLKVQEHYLPVMREAVKKGNANARSLALLEDRVALGQGKKQIYGSQIGNNKQTGENYVLPLEDPENVDKRRQEVGLGPMADYVKQFNIVWNAGPPVNSQHKRVEVTYIGNCGFLICSNGKKILIDALFSKGFDTYMTPADSTVSKICNGQEPFADAKLLLITHNHPDHFDVNMVCKYLVSNPENTVVAPSLVIQSIRNQPKNSILDKQLVQIHEFMNDGADTLIQGVKISSFLLQHDNRPGIENAGYLVEMDGVKIFHSGDNTGADTAEYERMKLDHKNVDLALLNFYGFWSSKEERDFSTRNIRPGNIVLMHIPPKEVNVVIDSSKAIRDFYDITVFGNCMEKKSFVTKKM